MESTSRTRRLLPQSVLWIALPLGLVMTAAIAAGLIAYQQVVSSLLVDRDRQLAALFAEQIGNSLSDQALVLQTALEATWARSGAGPSSLDLDPEIARRFSCCIVVTDPSGRPLTATPPGWQPGPRPVSELAPFQAVLQVDQPVFSDVIHDPTTDRKIVVMALGLHDARGQFAGVALAGLPLDDLPIAGSIRGLAENDNEFVYLVDSRGRAIYHPDHTRLGADLSDRPFVSRVIAGETGGMVWTTPTGERLVQGYAPIPGTDWGLIVREPWEVVVEPIRALGIGMALISLVVFATAAALLGVGVRRITRPISQLAAQIPRLAGGGGFDAPERSGVEEIDLLTRSFERMAEQVEAYRAGLRRYLKAVTVSQEDERRRLARDLHDETMQDLLAIRRALELEQARLDRPELGQAMQRIEQMLEQTMQGVREIARDLRPLMLEDLGLIPALRALLDTRAAEAGLDAEVRVEGETIALPAETELALYRISQEALTNARKHASASSVRIELAFAPDAVRLTIEDDGAGFRPPGSLAQLAQQGSFGLMGIQERVWAIGGELAIDSSPGHGTRIQVSVRRAE